MEGVVVELNRNDSDVVIKFSHKCGGLMINKAVKSDVRTTDDTLLQYSQRI